MRGAAQGGPALSRDSGGGVSSAHAAAFPLLQPSPAAAGEEVAVEVGGMEGVRKRRRERAADGSEVGVVANTA